MIELKISSAQAKECGLPNEGRFAVMCIIIDPKGTPEAFCHRLNLCASEAMQVAESVAGVVDGNIQLTLIYDHVGNILPLNQLTNLVRIQVVNG